MHLECKNCIYSFTQLGWNCCLNLQLEVNFGDPSGWPRQQSLQQPPKFEDLINNMMSIVIHVCKCFMVMTLWRSCSCLALQSWSNMFNMSHVAWCSNSFRSESCKSVGDNKLVDHIISFMTKEEKMEKNIESSMSTVAPLPRLVWPSPSTARRQRSGRRNRTAPTSPYEPLPRCREKTQVILT